MFLTLHKNLFIVSSQHQRNYLFYFVAFVKHFVLWTLKTTVWIKIIIIIIETSWFGWRQTLGNNSNNNNDNQPQLNKQKNETNFDE